MEASCTKVYLVHGKDLNSSNSYCKQRLDLTAASRKLSKMTGCLEIIEGEDDGQSKNCLDSASYGRPSSNAGDRPWSRGSISCFPPITDSSMSRRMNTPTKQISLQAVRRKEESTELFVDQVDWQPLTLENNRQIWKPDKNTGYPEPTKKLVQADGFRLEVVAETSWQLTEQLVLEPNKVTSQTETICEDDIVEAAEERGVIKGENDREEKNADDSDENEDEGDDDDSDSSEEEEEKLRAPNELLMEFVDCLMRKDFPMASKLCKMILLYEPENPEALKFQPLIEEKLVLDAEAEKEAAEENSDDDSDDESEDEDNSNDVSEDEDVDSSSEADSSEEEDDDGSDDEDCDGGSNGSGSNNNNNNNGIQGSCWQRHLK